MSLSTSKKLVWAILICLYCSLSASAQPETLRSLCKITKYDENSGLSQWHTTQIQQDKSGIIWIATWNGLNRFDGYEFQCFKSEVGDGCSVTTNRIRDFRLAENGNIYCKNDDTLFVFDTQNYTFRNISPEEEETARKALASQKQSVILSENNADQMAYKDKFGTQWTITKEGYIYYFDEKEERNKLYNTDNKLSPIRFCYADKQGNLWLLSLDGVYKLNFFQCPIKPFPQERPSQIRCFFSDNRMRYWVTSKDEATVRLYDSNNNLLGYLGKDGRLHPSYTQFEAPVYCIAQSSGGSIWLGCKPNGLYRLSEKENGLFEMKNFRPEEKPFSLNNENIYDIKEDYNGRLWIATLGGGLNCMLNPEDEEPRFIHAGNQLTNYPGKIGQRVRYLHITKDNILLAATTDGLVISQIPNGENFSQQQFKQHTKEANRATGLSCSATMDILENSRHHIFISTESGGVNQLLTEDLLADTLEFKHFNMKNGLPSDVTLSLTEHKGNIWIVCSNQIIVLNPYEEIINSFDAGFFQKPCRFSDAHPMQLPNGEWLFGLHDGAFTLATEMMQKSDYVPPIAITGISVQNREIEMAVNDCDTLILQPNERNLTIYFAALDYTETDRIHYAFRLDKGDSTPWNNIRRNRSATFLDMKPNTYTLMIQSTNADGVWVDNIRTLTIIVKPTFWETGWALLLYILTGLTIIATVIYTLLYIRRIKRQQKETLNAYLELINRPEEKQSETNEEEKVQEVITPSNLSTEEELFMKRIMAFVEEHIGNANINIGDMASAAATSRSGLNRKMKSILGVTPLDFLREARIKKACQILLTENSPVTEVAYRCGFSDPKYFSRCFKASIGVSPSEYKNYQEAQ